MPGVRATPYPPASRLSTIVRHVAAATSQQPCVAGTATSDAEPSTGAAAAAATATAAQAAPSQRQQLAPGDDQGYVFRGLCGLAHAMPRAGSMAGHLGAATITGGLLAAGVEGEIDPSSRPLLHDQLDKIMAGSEMWFNEEQAGVTVPELFVPVPAGGGQPAQALPIVEALWVNIGKLRQSGHNVIFASIALRALAVYPSLSSRAMVGGIAELIASFDGAVAGQGYYSTDTEAPSSDGLGAGRLFGHDAPLSPASETVVYTSIDSMVQVTLEELASTASEHRQGFGGLHHLINHAAALVVIGELGLGELAHAGLPAVSQVHTQSRLSSLPLLVMLCVAWA